MGKKKEKILTSSELGYSLLQYYQRWKHIFDNGCTDPSWEDGVNMNLVRNHILYHKKRIEEILGDNFIAYPDEYFYPVPVEVSPNFMAVDRYLPCQGKHLTSTKTLSYNEAVRFDFREVL